VTVAAPPVNFRAVLGFDRDEMMREYFASPEGERTLNIWFDKNREALTGN
jgi:hypothetical protein